MKKKPSGTYFSLRDEQCYDSLDGFEDKSEEVNEKTGVLAEQLALGIERLDYKIDNQQL